MTPSDCLSAGCRIWTAFLKAGALMTVPAVALATVDPKVSMSVSSVPDTVTVSTSSTQQTPVTYVAYLVTINGSSNDENLLQVDATVSVTSGLTPAVIQDSGVNPALPNGCTVAPGGGSLSCALGTLPRGAVLTFPVIVAVPQYAVEPVANQSITLSLHATFREGNSTGASGNSLAELDASANTPVAAQSDSSLKSVVIKAGGNVHTGGNGIPKASDVYTTAVAFQALSANFSLVTITETPFLPAQQALCIGGRHFGTCHSTLLFAPDVDYTLSGGFLSEIIRVHPANFVNGAKMATVIWEYVPTDANGAPAGSATSVSLCSSPTTPRTDGIPCQTGPVICYKKTTPGWTLELDGVCEWKFINTRNGLMRGY
jgi:hypothetical protein